MGSYDGAPTESVPVYVRYLGVRGPDSWINHPLDPPYNLGTGSGTAVFDIQGTFAASADLSHVLVTSKDALTPGATQGGSNHYIRDARTGALTLIATTNNQLMTTQVHGPQGGDLRKVRRQRRARRALRSDRPTDAGCHASSGASGFLYAWHAGTGLTLESVLPASEGGGAATGNLTYTYNSEDGEVDSAFYGDALTRVYFGTSGGVYLRSGGVTKAISVSRIAGDPATPVGGWVNAVVGDGRYVVFQTTGARLTDDTPNTFDNFIYRYDAVTDSLVYIGSTQLGVPGTTVIQVSSDGQTVAFRSPVQARPGGDGVRDQPVRVAQGDAAVRRNGRPRHEPRAGSASCTCAPSARTAATSRSPTTRSRGRRASGSTTSARAVRASSSAALGLARRCTSSTPTSRTRPSGWRVPRVAPTGSRRSPMRAIRAC